jgi:hypothetical protein
MSALAKLICEWSAIRMTHIPYKGGPNLVGKAIELTASIAG